MDYFTDIADERRGFADLVDTLTPQQLATPSLCGGWTVHDIAAHLVVPLLTGLGTVAIEMAKARGNFDRANMALTRSMARKSPAELASLLRRHAGSHFTPPGLDSIAPLTDAIIHGQDARRPLGIVREIPPARLLAILNFQVSPLASRGFVPKGRTAGLRFAASDLDWSQGDGPLVQGAAEALMMALAGRRVALDELSGQGLAAFTARP
jgi:uncharacterized protein (TIGR03083 family)